jgi:hypothetical protein
MKMTTEQVDINNYISALIEGGLYIIIIINKLLNNVNSNQGLIRLCNNDGTGRSICEPRKL